MARNKGIASFSANFEPQIAAPLDARLIVDTVNDLTTASTWQANDGSIYIYKGIVVSVINDPDPNSNGSYCLVADDYTQGTNWKVLSGGEIEMDNRIMDWESGKSYTQYTPLIHDSILYRVIDDSYTSSGDIEDDVDNDLIEIIGGSGGSVSGETLYTNTDLTEITVGGIEVGSTFEDMTMKEMWDALLYPELYPNLTNPSLNFTSSITGLREIGEEIALIEFEATFNQGTISPAYTTSGLRSGLPIRYIYTGTDLTTQVSSGLGDSKSISLYEVVAGAQNWTCQVEYEEGEQPLSNKGNTYDDPLPSGVTATRTVTITGVYPFFATTASISSQAKQTLALPSNTYWEVDMVKEEGSDKQSVSFHDSFPAITGVEFFNTVSNTWEWIGGSKSNSIATFTISADTKTVQGNSEDYVRYTHNGALIGARRLRFYK